MYQSTTPSLSQTIWARWASRQLITLPIAQTLLPVTFGYSLSSEAVVIWQLRRWKRMWQRSLTCSYKRTYMGPSSSCWNGTTSALQPEITSRGTGVSCVYYQLKCPYEKSLETYLIILVCLLKDIVFYATSISAARSGIFSIRVTAIENEIVTLTETQHDAVCVSSSQNDFRKGKNASFLTSYG